MQNLLSSLVQYLPAINQSQKQKKYLGPQKDIANAMIDPSNPLYARLYGENIGAANQNTAATIAELQRQNRKASALGRTALFDQGRGGETIFRGLMEQGQRNQESARTGTLRQLEGAYKNFDDIGTAEQRAGAIKAQGQSNLGSVIKRLFGL